LPFIYTTTLQPPALLKSQQYSTRDILISISSHFARLTPKTGGEWRQLLNKINLVIAHFSKKPPTGATWQTTLELKLSIAATELETKNAARTRVMNVLYFLKPFTNHSFL